MGNDSRFVNAYDALTLSAYPKADAFPPLWAFPRIMVDRRTLRHFAHLRIATPSRNIVVFAAMKIASSTYPLATMTMSAKLSGVFVAISNFGASIMV